MNTSSHAYLKSVVRRKPLAFIGAPANARDSGAAFRVMQHTQLTLQRIVFTAPTLIVVKHGVKRVAWPDRALDVRAGETIAVNLGATVDIRNTPGCSGVYAEHWIELNERVVLGFNLLHRNPVMPFVAMHVPKAARVHSGIFRGAVSKRITRSRVLIMLLRLRERGICMRGRYERLGMRLRKLIVSDPAFPWSIGEITRRARISPATLRRRLTEEQLTFRDLVHDARMSCALRLLQCSDTPILAIARAVGYDSASRFTAQFRARFGFLPSQVRGHRP